MCLDEILACNTELNQLIEERQNLYDRLTNTVRNYDEKTSSSDNSHKMDALVILNERIDRKFNDLLEMQIRLFRWLYNTEELNSLDRTAILNRYFIFNTYEQAAANINVTTKTLQRSHRKVMELLDGDNRT